MQSTRFIMVGGFLGAGKTTTLARLARFYMSRGQKIGLVTNDQAQDLVDTHSLREQGFSVEEVAGACFCCKFDDLVGKLLDETEELHKEYQSLKLSTNQNNNDAGDISKVGGKLNSTGAVAATGNKKPPTLESGGLARTGRQGARATGMVADDEGTDRRGRDKA